MIFSAAALLVGLNPHQRYGSTETLRLARQNRVAAPCGLIPAKSKGDVPRDSALKVGVMHGGGGPDSHTACSFICDGQTNNWESRGYPGVILNQCGNEIARAWDNPLFSDFWYLPAASLTDPVTAFPLPNGYYYGPADGPVESIAGTSGEPKVWLDRFKLWQTKAGATPDGTYNTSTVAAARKVQNAAGLAPTGFVDRKTWDAVMGGTTVTEPVTLESLDRKMTLILDQLGRGYPEWESEASLGVNSQGERRTLREAISALLKRS